MTEGAQTQEIQIPEYKARFLSALYVETNRAFDPNLFGKSQTSLNTPELKMAGEAMRKEMTRLLRERLVIYFLTYYKSNLPEGPKIDGCEHEGKVYGESFQEQALAKGREPDIVLWNDIPHLLGFEKFLPKK